MKSKKAAKKKEKEVEALRKSSITALLRKIKKEQDKKADKKKEKTKIKELVLDDMIQSMKLRIEKLEKVLNK